MSKIKKKKRDEEHDVRPEEVGRRSSKRKEGRKEEQDKESGEQGER